MKPPTTKADQLRELREAQAADRTGDEVESSEGGENAHQSLQGDTRETSQPIAPDVGVATDPSETKRKRAPAGTFDRRAYQREYMRKKRRKAEGKL